VVDYGKWERSAVEDFLARLARSLTERNYRIVSGFGDGVGGAVVSGAVKGIYSRKGLSIDEELVLRPFPLWVEDKVERQRIFDRYREDLVSHAGIALFLFGNKAENGNTVKADGVRAEFELAKKNRLCVVPVGSTGSTAEDLWTEVMADFGTYFPDDKGKIRFIMEAIGKPFTDPIGLLEPLLELVDLLAKE
jgi:hypothetical protein